MKLLRKYAFTIFIGFIIALLYRNWFFKGLLTAPDFSYISPLQLHDLRQIPSAWSSLFGIGLGGSTINILNLETYLHLGVRLIVFMMHISWNAAYRILFFWPFLLIGSVSSFYFCHEILKQKTISALGMLIYMTNTYVLMLAGGGQVGLMMAYAFAPLVLASFIKRNTKLFIFSTALLLLFDLRFSFLIVGVIVLYSLFIVPRREWAALMLWFIVPLLIVIGIHSFWIIPSIFGGGLALPEGYGKADWLKYLSWAEFSKTLSLLHPNWPENIFGKTYFFQSEFIGIPIVAFSSFLFIWSPKQKTTRQHILFFSLLSLVGAFLSKGINPPLGGVNEWFFLHVPFFNGFRDPTKFYLITIISYSVLIPFVVLNISNLLKVKLLKYKNIISSVTLVIFLGLWFLMARALVVGHVGGTFGKLIVPTVYDDFGKFIYSNNTFGRTLIVPWKNRFVFQSENHPVVNARDVFQTTDIERIAALFREPSTEMKLRQLAVKYVVVPDDFTNEIFLNDRSPDPELRSRVVGILDKLPYLDKIKRFDGLDYYEFTKFTGHFFTILPNLDAAVYAHRKVSPVTYAVDVTLLQRPVDVIFSEAYDPAWELWDGEKMIEPHKTPDGVMAFPIGSDITGQIAVHNTNQRWVDLGYTMTLAVLILIVLLGYVRLCRKYRLGFKIHVLLLTISIGMYVTSVQKNKFLHTLSDKDISWSTEWHSLYNPILDKPLMVSRYGGSEISFRVRNSKEITIQATSSNDEAHIQGLDVTIDGETSTLETPMYDARMRVDTINSLKKPVDVFIKHWCAGTMGPCDLAISDIQIDKGASIEPSGQHQKKILAVLGDSISVSFGNQNYTYTLAEKLGYRLHNASIFGSTVVEAQSWDWSMSRYLRDVVAYKPDVLLIFLGTNDLLHDKQMFRKNYNSMLREIREKSPNTKIISIGLLRRKDFARSQVTNMSWLIASIAEENNIQYIDPYNWLEESDLQDVVHPSPKSQQKLADKMYKALSSIMAN